MFQIGEFSRLGRVTIETLRHYNALGLLKPAKVDTSTGYRYYAAKQLLTLNRIMALKELGFSLDEIGRVLQDGLSSEQLRGMLKMQLVSTVRELQSTRSRLDRIRARLNYLDKEKNMPAYEVTLKSVEALTIAAIREVVPTIEQVPKRCGELFDTIAQWMKANHLPFGPSITIYFNESYTRENIDTECAFIIPNPDASKTVTPEEPIVVRQMEAAPQMASTIVADDFYKQVDGLTPAYHAIAQWIEDNDYRIVGPPRELFYGSPENGDLTAEIQFPVERG